MLLVDVRGVGLANVRGGSSAGDGTLRAVAAHLTSIVDADAEVCRASGDQFAVLVPFADAEAARSLADVIASAELATGGGRAEFVVGDAVAEPHSLPDAALREAEAAVRRARAGGLAVDGPGPRCGRAKRIARASTTSCASRSTMARSCCTTSRSSSSRRAGSATPRP